MEGGGGGELNLQLAQRAGVGAQGEVLLRVGSRAAGRSRGGRLEERRRRGGGGEEEERRGEVERHLVRLHEVEECPGQVPHFQQLELELVQRWDLEE